MTVLGMILSFVAGGIIGVFATSLAAVAGRSDKEMNHLMKKQDDENNDV